MPCKIWWPGREYRMVEGEGSTSFGMLWQFGTLAFVVAIYFNPSIDLSE